MTKYTAIQADDVSDLRNYRGDSSNLQLAFYYGPAYPNNSGTFFPFAWDDSSTIADDGSYSIAPNFGSSTGRWIQTNTGTPPQISSDWNATAGAQEILNKPTLVTIGAPADVASLSVSTAYQATTSTKPTFINLTLSSTATVTTLSGTSTNTADIYIGSTIGVATTGGTKVGSYANNLSTTITIGNLSSTVDTNVGFMLQAGQYYAVRVSAGTVTIPSKVEFPLT